MQKAFKWQLCVFAEHSSISVKIKIQVLLKGPKGLKNKLKELFNNRLFRSRYGKHHIYGSHDLRLHIRPDLPVETKFLTFLPCRLVIKKD